jgi:hypothetical protein
MLHVLMLRCSLAWAELRLGFAHAYRKFDLVLADPVYVVQFYLSILHFPSRLLLSSGTDIL